MTWQQGMIYHGFRLLNSKDVTEINSTAKLFVHEKSGARLLYIGNDDDNKVFSISFRTPPTDSTGVAHIVEHSVLCGSRKYPMKEPFVELVKGSLNTYLNAMTFPDKTMYPVASRNDKDFRNLMDVYLDAVFYPNMRQDERILMQEGWHYELEHKDADLTYKGVVYNEMKGVFSSPDAILENKIFATLFPDTIYGVDSGGDPDVIPELTQEQFLAFHQKYYHPANSYIFLYGKLDLDDQLKFLDENYLSSFDKIQTTSDIALQPPFVKAVHKVYEYPISPNENKEDKTFLSLNFAAGRATDAETCLAIQILEHLLLETSAAPLKKALVDAGIGKEVYGSYTKSILQPVFTIAVTGANEEQQQEFLDVINKTLRRLVEQGIDKKLIEASLNLFEFRLRDDNYGTRPKGLMYNIKCMDSWLYDADPLLHLEYEPILAKIKTALTSRYFEQLINTYLLNNTHQAFVVLRPKPGLAEERAAQIAEHLAQYKAQLSEAELVQIIEQTKQLKVRQETPDSPEALATIPLLQLTDIEPKTEQLPLVAKQEQNVEVLFHPLFTNEIAYVNLYFDMQAVPQKQLLYAFLLAEVLGKIATEKFSYSDLANEINLHTGGLTFDVVAYSKNGVPEAILPKFRIKTKALLAKLPQTLELTGQIIAASKFDDVKRLKELVQEIKASWTTNLFRRGQQIAASRALSYFSPVSKYNETGLLTFYQFIVALEKNFAQQAKEIAEMLQNTANLIFNRNNLLVSVTLDEKEYDHFQRALPIIANCLNDGKVTPQQYQVDCVRRNEGLMTPGKVQYVIKAANFLQLGYAYHGSLKVLDTILRYDYLWNRVRVQGGAYGAFTQFERNGNMLFGSYRDPNLKETLAVYDETAQYLNNFNVTDREMTKYIIGTISGVDTPLTAQLKGEKATEYYLRGISYADLQRERDEILATTQADIRKLAPLVAAAMQQNYLCVLGSEKKIRDSKEVFNELISVFE